MTYADVLERYSESANLSAPEFAALERDFQAWMKETGFDYFLHQRNMVLLIGLRFEEGGVNLWATRVLAGYDWEDAAIDERIRSRASQVKYFLDQQPPGQRPEPLVIAAALGMGPEYVTESLEFLESEEGLPRVADAPK